MQEMFMWQDFGTALALMLVIEGIMPFLNPSHLRQSMQKMIELDDKSLRIIGLTSMILGVILLYWIN